jgi:hypothetical protein
VADPDHGALVADVISADARGLALGGAVRVRLRDDVHDVVLIGGNDGASS